MKKISALVSVIGVAMLFSSSCRKADGITVTRVIPVELNVNETYRQDVPHAGDDDDVMQITKQGSNYLVSKITPASGGNVSFEYTPGLNFVGTDEVIISNEEGSHRQGAKGGHGNGNCNGGGGKQHHDNTVIYDFKITIKAATTRLTK